MKVELPESSYKMTIEPHDNPGFVNLSIVPSEKLQAWLDDSEIKDTSMVITEEPLQFWIEFASEAEAVMFRLAWSE